jgi:hypothetical protein
MRTTEVQLDARALPWRPVLGAVSFRIGCFGVMSAIAVWFEARPAPTLPDLLVSAIPYVPWVDRYNYLIWALAYLPVALALLWFDWRRFCRYNLAAGLLALLRGVCIALTGLGPVNGHDVHAGMSIADRLHALSVLLTLGKFGLTKDLFFSGHTATTFLLLLYAWRVRPLRAPALIGHVLVITTVFLAHLHYSIDVIGAYSITFALFSVLEWTGKPTT